MVCSKRKYKSEGVFANIVGEMKFVDLCTWLDRVMLRALLFVTSVDKTLVFLIVDKDGT